MIDKNRIVPFCDELSTVWKNNPDLRFAQLIVNLMQYHVSDMYYIEDECLMNKLKEFYNEN